MTTNREHGQTNGPRTNSGHLTDLRHTTTRARSRLSPQMSRTAALDKNPWSQSAEQIRSFLSSGCKSKKIAACQNPTAKLKGFWQVFVLLDHLRRQHVFNGPGDPRLAAYTGALQLGIGGFPAFNVLRPPADQNAGDAPPGFLGHHGHGEV